MDYKQMLYVLLVKMDMFDEISGLRLEKLFGKEYRDFYSNYECEIFKPKVQQMLKYYPIPMVVGAIHGLFQDYDICEDTEDLLYKIADPKEKWNECSEYGYEIKSGKNPLKTEWEPKTKEEEKALIVKIAKNHSSWINEENLSLDQIAELKKHFEKLGRKYGLLKRFREEDVC